MTMKRLLTIALLTLIVLTAGCLFKPPAEVRFSIDRSVVNPGDMIHLFVFINNTGKVGLTDAILKIEGDDFEILQEPDFPDVLPVGDSVQLVWIIRAPVKPGTYTLKLSLELVDALKRTWSGFYSSFRISVSSASPVQNPLKIKVSTPGSVRGGSEFNLLVEITNRGSEEIPLDELKLSLLPGMEIKEEPSLPAKIEPSRNLTLKYIIKAPYAHRDGYISAVLEYLSGNSKKSMAQSARITVIWQPWFELQETLKEAYGSNYRWISGGYLVDEYWVKAYNSTPTVDLTTLRQVALPIVEDSPSEVDAAKKLYSWLRTNYAIGGNTTTLNPSEMLSKKELSHEESQILLTALLRSVNVPARVVSLYNGTDCTLSPITEFYTPDGWHVIDVRQGIVGSREDFLASRRFPKIYQLTVNYGYRIVAQDPEEMKGHEHVDVTAYYLVNLQDRLYWKVSERVNPELRSTLGLVMEGMDENQALFTLFLFSSAPPDELNEVLKTYSAKTIRETIKPIYEFYWDTPWDWDFIKYWRVFREGLP
ncbi:MAG: hypothetical protein PWQ79_2005 [Thermococcaceae archaeon]|nr:hypothetical protein [Thermococcaceae archaeon]